MQQTKASGSGKMESIGNMKTGCLISLMEDLVKNILPWIHTTVEAGGMRETMQMDYPLCVGWI